MELSDRRRKILQAIVSDYISTAEPVGSSTISKKYDLGISPATIRNEMALLEEQGFLDKPHTSAGRVPSYLGYRVYVNELMQEYRLTLNEIKQIKYSMQKQYIELNKMVSELSLMMASLTNYPAVVTSPSHLGAVIKNIRLIWIDDYSIAMIIVADDGAVKNTTIRFKSKLDMEITEKLSNYLNDRFTGVDISLITDDYLRHEMEIVPIDNSISEPIFEFLSKTISDMLDVDMVMYGADNIFNYPEFNDVNKMKDFLKFIDSGKNEFIKSAIKDGDNKIQVYIGDDNPILKDKDLSMVVSNYSLGDGYNGAIAVIGPTRMDYSKVISTLEYITKNLKNYLTDIGE